MARYIRRHSMERLELYDLEKLATISPPPLPPARKTDFRRSSMNPSVERYHFLCNMTRNRTDPVYAATPMFTTIPDCKPSTSHRQLLGAYPREENVKQLAPATSRSPEKQMGKGQNNESEDEKNDNEKEKKDEQASDETDDEQFNSSSSNGSGEDGDDDEILEDDGKEEKGVVEQIINRDQKD